MVVLRLLLYVYGTNRAAEDLEKKGIDASDLNDDEWGQRVRNAQEKRRFSTRDDEFDWVSTSSSGKSSSSSSSSDSDGGGGAFVWLLWIRPLDALAYRQRLLHFSLTFDEYQTLYSFSLLPLLTS